MANNYTNLDLDLATLDKPSGKPPETRMADASQARSITIRSLQYDRQVRDPKRSRLKGLVDGNPPYDANKLIQAGRADECNVNWRIGRYFLGLAKGMVYDIFSEAPSYTTVVLDPYELRRPSESDNAYDPNASASQADDWSRIITEEFQKLQLDGDPNFDFCNQQSQGQSVFYGRGPMSFSDELDWRTVSHEDKMLVVPEIARSNTNYWDWAGIVQEYAPDQMYARIANTSAAIKRGWDVSATRESIMNAHPLTRTGVAYQSWSWHQDALKNGSFFYADQSKRLTIVRFYFREFPEGDEEEGRITEAMFEIDPHSEGSDTLDRYLYWGPKRYANWREVIHPFYWDHDLNGYHYSVNGLGIEMFSGLEYLNRLMCRNADDAMAPKLFFKPTTAASSESGNIVQLGRWAKLPVGWDAQQQQIQPFLQEGMAMSREIQSLVSSNLSQYRSSALSKQQGNPVTARQIDYEASEQAKMGKTQLSRIYEQYDWLYAEKYRRATNPKLTASVRGGPKALEFWKCCERRGVPKWALTKTASVRATRVIGQGSQYLRQQALEFLLGLMTMLPEDGRTNLVRDVIASRAGQAHVDRYAPKPDQLASDEAAQNAEAMLQVSSMKTGVPPVPVSTQNPLIFASVFIQAGEGSVQAVQQGGDPHETAAFLQLDVQAIAGHLQRLSQDKSREQSVKELTPRFQELGKALQTLTDMLQKQQVQQAQAQQQMAEMQQGTDPETQVEMAKVQSRYQHDMAKLQAQTALKAQKQQVDLGLKAQKMRADMALKAHQTVVSSSIADAEAAAGIARETAVTRAKVANANKPKSNGEA